MLLELIDESVNNKIVSNSWLIYQEAEKELENLQKLAPLSIKKLLPTVQRHLKPNVGDLKFCSKRHELLFNKINLEAKRNFLLDLYLNEKIIFDIAIYSKADTKQIRSLLNSEFNYADYDEAEAKNKYIEFIQRGMKLFTSECKDCFLHDLDIKQNNDIHRVVYKFCKDAWKYIVDTAIKDQTFLTTTMI